MSADFAELDYQKTPLGELILRRRRIRALDGIEVYEVKLGEAFLMSSLFHEAEEALAELGLAGMESADVVVGGLGLGYTAAAALGHAGVRSVIVVEALEPVIGWHRRGLVPLGARITGDPRCRIVAADFFAMAKGAGFDPERPGRVFDAILLDIDHSPGNLLDASNGAFYTIEGLRGMARWVRAGGIFAMWSDHGPDEAFLQRLRVVFAGAEGRVVRFPNPLVGGESASTVYLARKA